jgi:hypothetical protein
MAKRPEWLADSTVRWVLAACLIASLIDVILRISPARTEADDYAISSNPVLFARRAPSARWGGWYEGIQAEAFARVADAEAEQERLAAEAAVKPAAPPPRPIKDEQSGDLETFRVDGFNYQLWGVFNKRHEQSDEVFGVLKSKEGRALQIREGDTLGGYRVTSISHRAIQFDSVEDERKVTLWMFGKGPR